VKVICRKNGADSRVFTDGKIYAAYPRGSNGSKLVQVRDDRGHARFTFPGEPCAHLTKALPGGRQECVGWFEIVKEGK
jgi:hypothetical protein